MTEAELIEIENRTARRLQVVSDNVGFFRTAAVADVYREDLDLVLADVCLLIEALRKSKSG